MKAEIRGRGKAWKVWYQSEEGMATTVPVFDRDGVHVRDIEVGAPSDKLVEANFPGGTKEEAWAYALSLGCEDITYRLVAKRPPQKARARRVVRLEL